MVDPIQRGSSIPIPQHQTLLGGQNPSVASSPRALETEAKTRAEADGDKARDGFEAYLNQQSITLQERVQAKALFDPIDAIKSGSVYSDPGETKPI